LAVGEVEVGIEKRDAIVIADGLTMDKVLMNLAAERMASRARLDFALRPDRRGTH
jgi:hypothetical protein